MDSAGGSAKTARDRQTQAIMALQGKILNAQRNDLTKLLKNQEIRNIIQAIGCGIGPEFDYNELRYNKIILMMDSDTDGGHIQVLLLTFLFKHMPELIEKGNVYLAMAPLYRVTKGSESEYLLDESELSDYTERNKGSHYEVNFFKGLGEMDPEELNQTTLDPATRRLKQITIDDAMRTRVVFEDLMGSSVIPRRTFIEENANMADTHI